MRGRAFVCKPAALSHYSCRGIERFDIVPRLRYFYRRHDTMLKEAAMSNIPLPSEPRRNQMASIDKARLAQGHAVSIRSGEASAASMDGVSFDRTMSIVKSDRRREMAIHQGLMRGCADFYEGKISDARGVLDSIRAKNSWSCRLQSQSHQ